MTQITHLRDQNSTKIPNVTLKIEGAHRIVIATRAIARQSLRCKARVTREELK
jgi:hypothetical protein